ncbi:hypothetical protein [Neptunomonas sp.]|jgi:hypothetical protein|uniref:hypothetical protein n=1 Tax=Neptunomonas TaxID=75687 RepID=UPI0035182CDA
MKVKNIIISLSSVLIISAALPAAAHQGAQSGAHANERQSEGLTSEVFPSHTDKSSATNTHYMMHSGGDHQGHLMEGGKHGENQATEHQKEIITHTHSPSNTRELIHVAVLF